MKKIIYLLGFLFVFSLNAQKNKNGVIYDKHPGIDLISTLHQAMTDGDIEKAAEILHDDLRWIDGNTNNREWGGKQRVLNNISWFKNNFDYVSFKDSEGAYPDMLEYKRSGNWVQSWVNIYAVHKITGFKLDHPVLRIYSLNDDSSKITGIIEYSNRLEFSRLGDSRTERKNGIIYNSHENINSVRKAMYAYVNGDVERAMSFFHENASWNDINESKIMNQEEILARDAKMFEGWEIAELNEVGYPDYFEYDYRNSKVVSSWWNFVMVRKSDGKKVTVPVHFSDSFDDEGKIYERISYWNKTLID